jgi:ABC-2 type transport system permease protein
VRRLLLSELRRLTSRRLGMAIVALAILGIVIAGIIVFFRATDASRLERARSDPELRQSMEACERGDFGIPPEVAEREGGITEACLTAIGVPGPFKLTDVVTVLQGTTVPLIFISWLVGATFIGADWQKGTMTTALTWEPRRLRLYAAKVTACFIVVFTGYLVLQLLMAGALLPTAFARGITSGVDRQWYEELVGTLLRGGLLATLASIVGMAIATIGRNTGAALGAGFAYLAIIESLVRGLKPEWVPYLFGDNGAVFVTARPQDLPEVGHTTLEAGLVLISYAIILGALAAGTFRARDVT